MQSTVAEKPYLPRVAQPSFWQQIIPKPLRKSSNPIPAKRTNPANYFIWIYLLIGSQAIRILTIKNESIQNNRIADQKLRQLREVIERLENGEDVDVEKLLGTGNETAEQEWEQALKELESEERLWQTNRQKRKQEKQLEAEKEVDNDPVDRSVAESQTADPVVLVDKPSAPGFY